MNHYELDSYFSSPYLCLQQIQTKRIMGNKKCKVLLTSLAVLFLIGGCSSGGDEPTPPAPTPPTPTPQQIAIKLSCGIETRVTDNAYESGDQIGLYVVNYDGEQPGTLQASGNHASNVCFSYSNGTWTPTSTIYWKDETTPADFYAYHPYGTPADVEAYPFSVKGDQSTAAAYKASDFLYGKSSKVAPTESTVNIMTRHLFSCTQVKVEPGDGFTAESLAAAAIEVRINGVQTEALINLRTGEARATGATGSIRLLQEGTTAYKALIVPQSVPEGSLISIVVDGREYRLQKAFTFEGGKRHTFTVSVSKTSSGINVGITGWEEDETDHGGTAE